MQHFMSYYVNGQENCDNTEYNTVSKTSNLSKACELHKSL